MIAVNNSSISSPRPFNLSTHHRTTRTAPQERRENCLSDMAARAEGGKEGGKGTFSMLILFVVWYAFSAGYVVYNQKIKIIACPWMIACAQMAVGLTYAFPLWILGVRKIPNLGFSDIMTLLPIAILNAFGHACAVVAMFEKVINTSCTPSQPTVASFIVVDMYQFIGWGVVHARHQSKRTCGFGHPGYRRATDTTCHSLVASNIPRTR